ncbi:MAG: ABC-F family ATP-binding cassette domain-containing protein [Myxococcota bacterium]
MLLRLEGIGRHFGARELFREADLHVAAGDRIGLIGRNGVGKTSLLRIAAGEDEADAGRVIRSRGVRVGLLRQEIDPAAERSVREEAATATLHLDALEAEIRDLESEMAQLGERGEEVHDALAETYDRQRNAFAFAGGFERDAQLERVLAGLGFAERDFDQPLSAFSGGWLMRVELAKLLLGAPDILLLDEPTNHLDLPSIQWFEETLRDYRGGVIVISHDRAFLRRHATRMAELERGGLIVFEGGYDRYLEARAAREEELRARAKNQQREIAETERFVERFRYKASKARQVQSRIKALEKLDRIESPEAGGRTLRLRIPEPRRSGDSVVQLEAATKAYGDQVVYAGVDFALRRGERVALVGPNGAGKSTLLRMVAGVLAMDGGDRALGHHVDLAFYAQHQLESLDPSRTVYEELERDAVSDDIARLRGHLGAFLFSGDDVEKRVSVLSGGEKARLALAKLLLRPTNFLILDEPTNHLDVESCEVLEGALSDYAGTLLFISHDRDFIDALATRVVDVRDGQLESFPGNYDDYQRGRAKRVATGEAETTTRRTEATAAPSKQERIAAREREKARQRALQREKKRLAQLEEEILAREERCEELTGELAAPDVYSDADFVRATVAARDEVRQGIDALYVDWEAAAAEIERLEGEAEAPSDA